MYPSTKQNVTCRNNVNLQSSKKRQAQGFSTFFQLFLDCIFNKEDERLIG